MIYKATFKKILGCYFWSIAYLLFAIILGFHMETFGDSFFMSSFLLVVFIILPTTIMHFQYYFNDIGCELKFSSNTLELNCKKKNANIIEFRDIDKIDIVKPSANFGAPWGFYKYSRITLNSGEKITLTCFLISPEELTRKIKNSRNNVQKEIIVIHKEKHIPFLGQ